MLRWMLLPLAVLRTWRVVLLPLLVLTTAVLSAVSLGRALPAQSFQLEPGECTQPCWQGFATGVTSAAEVLAEVEDAKRADPDSLTIRQHSLVTDRLTVEWETRTAPVYRVNMRFEADVLDRIDLFPREALPLGELFALFGTPTHVVCQEGVQFLTAQLYFLDGQISVWANLARHDRGPVEWQISPDMQVTRITYGGLPVALRDVPPAAFPWRGFVRVNDKGVCF